MKFRKKDDSEYLSRDEIKEFLKHLKRFSTEILIGDDPTDDLNHPDLHTVVRISQNDKVIVPLAFHLIHEMEEATGMKFSASKDPAVVHKAILIASKHLIMHKESILAEEGKEL